MSVPYEIYGEQYGEYAHGYCVKDLKTKKYQGFYCHLKICKSLSYVACYLFSLSSPSLGFAGGKSFLATIHFGDTGLNLVECADW